LGGKGDLIYTLKVHMAVVWRMRCRGAREQAGDQEGSHNGLLVGQEIVITGTKGMAVVCDELRSQAIFWS
jgi:hypothetical protein